MAKRLAQGPEGKFNVTLPFSTGKIGEITAAALTIVVIYAISGNVENPHLMLETWLVIVGPVLGYMLGHIPMGLRNFTVNSRVSRDNLMKLSVEPLQPQAAFLSITAVSTGLYIVLYHASLRKFLTEEAMSSPSANGSFEWPVNLGLVAITAVALGLLGFFSVRYAAYVRLTSLLELSLKGPRDKEVIAVLRKSVFRGDQLFEPAGNIFVTLGLIATFLGLAASLVALDLPGLVNASNTNVSNDAASAGAGATSGLTALSSFVGCMGLALGVSMLGVITALAAQWLRGHGAEACTEDLLAEANSVKAPVKKAATTVGAPTVPAVPTVTAVPAVPAAAPIPVTSSAIFPTSPDA